MVARTREQSRVLSPRLPRLVVVKRTYLPPPSFPWELSFRFLRHRSHDELVSPNDVWHRASYAHRREDAPRSSSILSSRTTSKTRSSTSSSSSTISSSFISPFLFRTSHVFGATTPYECLTIFRLYTRVESERKWKDDNHRQFVQWEINEKT